VWLGSRSRRLLINELHDCVCQCLDVSFDEAQRAMHSNRNSMCSQSGAVYLSRLVFRIVVSTLLHGHVSQDIIEGLTEGETPGSAHEKFCVGTSIREVPRVVDMLGTYLR
jgi:hypothetical protein